ncbi:MAG TPA: SDR family NAD(P)-dependent oxidoreductase [Beijerinckiaceae bacterium]
MSGGSAIIQGVGPGLGAALVRRFRAEGLRVAAVARDRAKLEALFGDDAGVTCYGADATNGEAVGEIVAQTERDLGPLAVAVANSAAWKVAPFLDLSEADLEAVWRQGVLPAFHLAQHAARAMAPRGAGTLLFTGSAAQMRAPAGFAALGVAKSGLRALAQALAREMGPRGLHVAHVVIDGPIDSPRTRAAYTNHDKLIDPAGIAEVYALLHRQPRAAWTNEIDVRTFSEYPA